MDLTNYAHVIPLGLELDRTLFLLKIHPPYKLHFLDPDHIDEEYKQKAMKIRDEVIKLYPVASKVYHEVCCYDFGKILLEIIRIMANEKKSGNIAVPHIFSGSRIYAIALYVAACLVGQELEYVRAKNYFPKGVDMHTKGVLEETHTTLQSFPIIIPEPKYCAMLKLLEDHMSIKQDQPWKGTRKKLAVDIRPYWHSRNLKPKSELTEVSKCLSYLANRGYLTHKRTPGGRMTLELKPSGRLLIRAQETLRKHKAE